MLPVLRIGPLALQAPGLLLLIGVLLGLSLAERRLPKGGPTGDQLYNLTFLIAAAGVLGARLSFAIQNFTLFRASPLNLFSLDVSLLDPLGGAAAALIAAFAYGWRKKLKFGLTLDTFTPALAVLAVFLGLSHLASGAAFGAPTSLPWGIPLWGAVRHPSQGYEALAALGILVCLWTQFRKAALPGRLFLKFLALSAAARLLLEAWRGDSILVFGGIRLAQIAAWIILTAALVLMEIQNGRKSQLPPG